MITPTDITTIRMDSRLNAGQFAAIMGINPARLSALENPKATVRPRESELILLEYFKQYGIGLAKNIFLGGA